MTRHAGQHGLSSRRSCPEGRALSSAIGRESCASGGFFGGAGPRLLDQRLCPALDKSRQDHSSGSVDFPRAARHCQVFQSPARPHLLNFSVLQKQRAIANNAQFIQRGAVALQGPAT